MLTKEFANVHGRLAQDWEHIKRSPVIDGLIAAGKMEKGETVTVAGFVKFMNRVGKGVVKEALIGSGVTDERFIVMVRKIYPNLKMNAVALDRLK